MFLFSVGSPIVPAATSPLSVLSPNGQTQTRIFPAVQRLGCEGLTMLLLKSNKEESSLPQPDFTIGRCEIPHLLNIVMPCQGVRLTYRLVLLLNDSKCCLNWLEYCCRNCKTYGCLVVHVYYWSVYFMVNLSAVTVNISNYKNGLCWFLHLAQLPFISKQVTTSSPRLSSSLKIIVRVRSEIWSD